ncbi:MAG TPA: hypothetical protein GX743_00455 [Actinomycetales bacterium]|nr:hypothetical protein [Actinomycetales bacterium]
MAFVRSLQPGAQNIAPHGTEVDCFYQFIDALDGRILHLSTFGSDTRSSEPKSIMALQFDRETALYLARVILEHFVDPELEDYLSSAEG